MRRSWGLGEVVLVDVVSGDERRRLCDPCFARHHRRAAIGDFGVFVLSVVVTAAVGTIIGLYLAGVMGPDAPFLDVWQRVVPSLQIVAPELSKNGWGFVAAMGLVAVAISQSLGQGAREMSELTRRQDEDALDLAVVSAHARLAWKHACEFAIALLCVSVSMHAVLVALVGIGGPAGALLGVVAFVMATWSLLASLRASVLVNRPGRIEQALTRSRRRVVRERAPDLTGASVSSRYGWAVLGWWATLVSSVAVAWVVLGPEPSVVLASRVLLVVVCVGLALWWLVSGTASIALFESGVGRALTIVMAITSGLGAALVLALTTYLILAPPSETGRVWLMFALLAWYMVLVVALATGTAAKRPFMVFSYRHWGARVRAPAARYAYQGRQRLRGPAAARGAPGGRPLAVIAGWVVVAFAAFAPTIALSARSDEVVLGLRASIFVVLELVSVFTVAGFVLLASAAVRRAGQVVLGVVVACSTIVNADLWWNEGLVPALLAAGVSLLVLSLVAGATTAIMRVSPARSVTWCRWIHAPGRYWVWRRVGQVRRARTRLFGDGQGPDVAISLCKTEGCGDVVPPPEAGSSEAPQDPDPAGHQRESGLWVARWPQRSRRW